MDSLIIKKHWLDLIFSGKKTWEIRSTQTHKRGLIGLIESGSGEIKGTCELIDSKGPLTEEEINNDSDKHQINSNFKRYKNNHAWIIIKAEKYSKPKKYKHPKGAIIWVKT